MNLDRFSRTQVPPNSSGVEFSPYPALVQVNDDHWVLLGSFSYTGADGTVYTAPMGMVTDLASIPRPLWNILPPFGQYTGAAVIHDFLYQTQTCTKEQADLVLAEAMDAAGVTHFIREAIYKGVDIGGWPAWNSHALKPDPVDAGNV